MRRCVPIIVMTLLIVSGCATQQDLNALKNQVDLLQSRLTMTETKVAENSKLTDQGLKQQGELQNRYSELQNQMFTLQGSIDQVSAAAGLTSTGGGETKISKLEKDVQSLKDLLQVKVTASGSVAAQKSLYDSGYEKFKSGLFSDAVQDFKGYLAQNPDPAIAGNAYFYMGESLYAQAKYDDAILSYDTVVKKFKDSDKVPEALYKQGLAFLKMGDKETGTLILQQLIKDHAGTEAALKAKKALKNPPSGKG